MGGVANNMFRYRKKPLPTDGNTNGARLYITESVVDTIDMLLPKQVEDEDHENALYIAGFIEGDRRIGCIVIDPGAETGLGHYRTSRESHAAVVDILDHHDAVVVAQVHCHPGWETYHSDADDDLAFVHVEGHWSLVVPYYGHRGMRPLSACGIHRYASGRFWLLSSEAALRRVIILPDAVTVAGNTT